MKVIVVCLLFLGMTSVKASTTFIPQLSGEVGYSDNIELALKGNEQSESIFEVNPGFLLLSEGRAHTLMARYRMRNIFYSEDQERNIRFNQLQADVTKELLGETFFIDGSILHTQGATSPENFYNVNSAASPGSVRNETYSNISPYIKYIFDSSISSELRYEFGSALYEDSSLDNVNKTVLLHFDSMLNESEFNWAFDYSRSDIEYDVGDAFDIRQEKTNIMLQYRLSGSFAMYSDIGYDNNSYAYSEGERPVGSLWMAGFIWAPSSRTLLKIGAGERFYGSTYFLDIQHRSRRLEQAFRYSEDIVTVSQVQSAVRTFNASGRVEPPSFNTLALSADAFIRKRADFNIGYDVAGNRIGIEGVVEKMENQTNIGNTGSQESKNAGMYWEKRLTKHAEFRLSSRLERRTNSFQSGESQIKYSELSIRQDLAQNASLSVSYFYSDSKGPQERQNYIENYINSSINLEW